MIKFQGKVNPLSAPPPPGASIREKPRSATTARVARRVAQQQMMKICAFDQGFRGARKKPLPARRIATTLDPI
ncbi:hypothetical protein [Rhodobacter capsulatus]|jgi:hypothetical protein|uniref:hypothetical protein n=1 Tax=Rhodobacter capsulatus TaxID=1061 RepID=UPI0019D70E25|nr:hypothetical protein [Rhodobacter capsulatus]